MSDATDRAEHLRAQRPIHDWVRRFRQLAKEMPPEVWVFVAGDAPHVMATTERGDKFVKPGGGGIGGGGGMDPDAIIATVNTLHCGQWDGGDW